VEPQDSKIAQGSLATDLGAYFQEKEGRGRSCHVDAYRRENATYFFAYPEDYGQVELEWDEAALRRRPHRPTFEVIFIYCLSAGTLDTYFHGPVKTVRELQQVFGRVILNSELGEPAKDERVYDFNRFKRPDFPFVYPPDAGIRDVRVKLVRLTVIGAPKKRFTIEADPADGRNAVYDLLPTVVDVGSRTSVSSRIPLALTNVSKVGIQATFIGHGQRRPPTRTFYVSYPNGCTLGHDGNDAMLRRMLVDSGIEPRVPSDHVEAA
jgi:hypothetical protein